MNPLKLNSNTEVDLVAAKYFCFPQIVCCYSCPRAFSSHFKLCRVIQCITTADRSLRKKETDGLGLCTWSLCNNKKKKKKIMFALISCITSTCKINS